MGILSRENKLILARISDLAEICEKKKTPQFSSFLHPRDVLLIKSEYRPPAAVKMMFYGGYDEAERCVVGFFPHFYDMSEEDFPLSVIKIVGAEEKTHRDFLGSVLGLGIKREVIGDISITAEGAFMFAQDSICDYICLNLKKIGRQNVVAEKTLNDDVKISPREFIEKEAVISSMRLDAFVSCFTRLSRNEALDAIKKEKVTLNWQIVTEPDKKISKGDIVSVRGYGRVRVGELLGETKKGRIKLMLYFDKQ